MVSRFGKCINSGIIHQKNTKASWFGQKDEIRGHVQSTNLLYHLLGYYYEALVNMKQVTQTDPSVFNWRPRGWGIGIGVGIRRWDPVLLKKTSSKNRKKCPGVFK